MQEVGTTDRSSAKADIQARSTGTFLCSIPLQHRSLPNLGVRDRPTRLRIGALSTSSTLQSAGRRRNMLSTQCSAALNQRQTAAIGRTREKRQD